MDFPALQAHLTTEAARLKAAVLAAGPDAPVPSCPEWTAADLLDHVAETYDHKIQSMRLMRSPGEDFRIERPGGPAEQFEGALADLTAEFDARGPDTLAYTWYGPDQTVGFWIRRMAHETVVHRADAELAAGREPGPVDDALALDGIDEMLTIMLEWGSRAYRDYAADALKANDGLTVGLDAGSRSWTVRIHDGAVSVSDGIHADTRTDVHGSPGDVLLWLWRRLPVAALTAKGDAAKAAALYDLIAEFAQ
ncbi:maleylpyruvate isomerase family mycothiol-dependent enzyme [Glycomyces harbinensis]|uniref:TIGR03083 family protein n=1 Tax=Glycomyces harbinensis TaxID=58114 RepID=A0A1G6RIF9_9ACTN|nr:maleylpyruvate isomerase family mycothiol-dependent enzyme [Glycomyces harbinensis]SDD03706.1 TIGR03083 family protein [Glycomyces harbinensis]